MDPLPVNVREFAGLAQEALPEAVWNYVAGGAADELTLVGNEAAWRS